MADLKKLIRKYLQSKRVMHLATSVKNKPWVCNLHYYTDEDLNFYWISTLERRHSKEITNNQHVAVTIKVHEDTPDEQYVIGLSAEGKAELMTEKDAKKIADHYKNKLAKPQTLIDDIFAGRNPHKFYRLKPKKIVLFDNKTFPDNPRQEYNVT